MSIARHHHLIGIAAAVSATAALTLAIAPSSSAVALHWAIAPKALHVAKAAVKVTSTPPKAAPTTASGKPTASATVAAPTSAAPLVAAPATSSSPTTASSSAPAPSASDLSSLGSTSAAASASPSSTAISSSSSASTSSPTTTPAPSSTPASSGSSSAPSGTYQFDDEFNGAAGALADPSKWAYQTGGNWSNGTELEQTTNRAVNAHQTGTGSLLITAQGETYTGKDKVTRNYTSARLMSTTSVLYGTVSARIKMSAAKGAWPAFWTMGANYATAGWPQCGELDVLEANNSLSALYGSFHGPDTNGPYKWSSYNAGKGWVVPGGLADTWHVYSATWTPTFVTFSLDGIPYVTINRATMPANQMWALDNPQDIILNIAVGGSMGGTPAAPADFKATMEVDWVRVTSAS